MKYRKNQSRFANDKGSQPTFEKSGSATATFSTIDRLTKPFQDHWPLTKRIPVPVGVGVKKWRSGGARSGFGAIRPRVNGCVLTRRASACATGATGLPTGP